MKLRISCIPSTLKLSLPIILLIGGIIMATKRNQITTLTQIPTTQNGLAIKIKERSQLIERLRAGLARIDEVETWIGRHESELTIALDDQQITALRQMARGIQVDDDLVDSICEALPDLPSDASLVLIEMLAWRGYIRVDDNSAEDRGWGNIDAPTLVVPAHPAVIPMSRRVFRIPILGFEIPFGRLHPVVKTAWSGPAC